MTYASRTMIAGTVHSAAIATEMTAHAISLMSRNLASMLGGGPSDADDAAPALPAPRLSDMSDTGAGDAAPHVGPLATPVGDLPG